MRSGPARAYAETGIPWGERSRDYRGNRDSRTRFLAAVLAIAALALVGLTLAVPGPVRAAAGLPAVHNASGDSAAFAFPAASAAPSAANTATAAETEEVYDAVKVVERALTHHLGVRAGQLQYLLGQAQAQETRAQLRPVVALEAMPFGFGQQVSEPDIDRERLEDAWRNGRWLEVLELIWDFVSRIDWSGLPMRPRDVTGTGYRVSLSVRTPVWRSPLQEAMGTLADLESLQAHEDWEAAVGMAILQSLDAYYNVLRAQGALRVAEAALREAEYRSREQAARVMAGTATEIDRLQAEAERYGAQAELLRAQGELRAARMALNQSLGFPLETQLTVVEWMPGEDWPELEEALAVAQDRAEVQRARRDLERAQAAQRIAQEQAKPTLQVLGRYRWPDVELSLSLDRHGYLGAAATANQQFVDGRSVGAEAPNWMAGVEMRWPLLDGEQRAAQLGQAALQVQLAALQVEQAENTTRTEVTAAYARLLAAREALDAAEQGVEAARRGLAIARELRAGGAATEGDVLRAETAVARAEQGQLEAAYGATLSQAAYLQAVGVLVPYWLDMIGDDLPLERMLVELDLPPEMLELVREHLDVP